MTNGVSDEKLPTLAEIRRSIPERLFVPDHRKSALLFAETIAYCFALFLFAAFVIPLMPGLSQIAGWAFYWFMQTTMFWRLFWWGHVCGHDSFWRSRRVNAIVGNLVHSFLLTPYASWRLTHRRHHNKVGNIDDDTDFPPARDHSKVRLRKLSLLFGIAYFLYLGGISSRRINHFKPSQQLYQHHRSEIKVSLALWTLCAAAVCYSIYHFGLTTVIAFYGIPIFGYATWLGFSSILNHLDPQVPWWGTKTWTYSKASIFSVIDVSYGPVLDYLLINNGVHQIHHIFPGIPVYHMKEATRHLQAAYPQLVKAKKMGVFEALRVGYRNYLKQPPLPSDIDVFAYDGTPGLSVGSRD